MEELRVPDGFQSEVLNAVAETAKHLDKNGAKVDPVSIPASTYGLSAYYIIAPSEASSNFARFD